MGLTGGPDLKARLLAVAQSGPSVQSEWAIRASDEMQGTAPRRTGTLVRSIKPRWKNRDVVGVYGAYWGIFIDRGTKAHTIEPRKAKALKFDYQGRTVFTRKVVRRRMGRRPFITAAAQNALRDVSLRDQIVQAWNRKRARGTGFRKFTL